MQTKAQMRDWEDREGKGKERPPSATSLESYVPADESVQTHKEQRWIACSDAIAPLDSCVRLHAPRIDW